MVYKSEEENILLRTYFYIYQLPIAHELNGTQQKLVYTHIVCINNHQLTHIFLFYELNIVTFRMQFIMNVFIENIYTTYSAFVFLLNKMKYNFDQIVSSHLILLCINTSYRQNIIRFRLTRIIHFIKRKSNFKVEKESRKINLKHNENLNNAVLKQKLMYTYHLN